jgi:predicted DsbA family dithiol-disulfide isomerase
VEAGLKRDDVEKWLESREGAEIVAAMEEEATKIGVQGVPFFGIGRYGIPGAYPADSLRDVILKAARESAEEA